MTALRISNSFCVKFTDTAELINCIFLCIMTTLEGMSEASIIAKYHRKEFILSSPETSRSLFIGQCLTDSLSSLGLYVLQIRWVCTFVVNGTVSIKII